MSTIIPKNYRSKLSIYDTQVAIGRLKEIFISKLSKYLDLKRVSAPLFVESFQGLNDNLNGYERPVSFDILNVPKKGEIVHSLAKWKRVALGKYDIYPYKGLYTDMNAIRRDEELDNIHSIYVDQWDWEIHINECDRNINYLKDIVSKIVHAIHETSLIIKEEFPSIEYEFSNEVTFITSEELLQMYPNLSPKERELAAVKKYGNVFLMQIGDNLSNGTPHDGRSPDYDDWMLNGDLLTYNKLLDIPFELSSMGIRVNKESLVKQLEKKNSLDRLNLNYHQMILNDEIPLSIGGGIGQSRLAMLMLEKAHIGEVQVSIWDDETLSITKENNIKLL